MNFLKITQIVEIFGNFENLNKNLTKLAKLGFTTKTI